MKIFCFLFMVLFISCGKSGDNKKKIVSIQPQDLRTLLEQQDFECESIDSKDCPNGIARLFIVNQTDPNQSGLCTGFLTSSKRLITNAHCIPTQEECENTYVAVYLDGRTEIAQCEKLIKLYEDFRPLERKALDVAIVDLDKEIIGVEGLDYSQQLITKNQSASIWVVDHISLFQARITELECILDRKSSSLIFRKCASIAGNSGAPVLNNEGRVLGILWGSTTDEAIDEFYPLIDRRELPARTYATDVLYFKDSF